MKIKTAIKIIEYSNLKILLGLLIIAISFVAKQKDHHLNIFFLIFSIPFIISFIVTKLMVHQFIKRSKYPGVFYSVLDKMNLTKNIDISLSDELLNALYKPAYSTEEFLLDNNLKTEIAKNKLHLPIAIIVSFASFMGLIYFSSKFSFQENPIVFLVLSLTIATNIFFTFKERKSNNDTNPIIRFESKGLYIENLFIEWVKLYDWQYSSGSNDSYSGIIISYYDSNDMPVDHLIMLSNYNTNKLELLMLLAHFKYKYEHKTQHNTVM